VAAERPRALNPDTVFLAAAVVGIATAGVLALADLHDAVHVALVVTTLVGLVPLTIHTVSTLRRREAGVDLIALLALVGALAFGQFLAGAVIALMLTSGRALEDYADRRAHKELSALLDRAPRLAHRYVDGTLESVGVEEVRRGDLLLVKTGEVVPVDGLLGSTTCVLDESALTGEARPVEWGRGDQVRSGAVNAGPGFDLRAVATSAESTYAGIVRLVEEAEKQKAPFVRLADRYALWFIPLTLVVAGLAWVVSGDPVRALAVLVVATPCPLLIAAPISFIGGLNKAARKNIIIKSPLVLELLAKTKLFFFDKTGTLTLGQPRLKKVELFEPSFSKDKALAIAAALEQHSFHPIAKALVQERCFSEGEALTARDVEEKIGEGIFGMVGKSRYGIIQAKQNRGSGMAVDLATEGESVARVFFDDELKQDVGRVFDYLRGRGYTLGILTGDKKANAERLFGQFRLPIYAECRPERKAELIRRYQRAGELVGMVGDGMNDAPALALSDIGIVFSGTENSASIEAADVAIFGRDAWLIRDAIHIGRRSYHVALQSILIGIGLSVIGMSFAFFGFISPLSGAILQEVIDVVVILNALRSTY